MRSCVGGEGGVSHVQKIMKMQSVTKGELSVDMKAKLGLRELCTSRMMVSNSSLLLGPSVQEQET